LVYVRNTPPVGITGTSWYPLPFTQGSSTINLVDFAVGQVDLQANYAQASGLDFRIVVISGTALTTLARAHQHLNFNNFDQVAAALHLSN
jgi:hypothetical protein